MTDISANHRPDVQEFKESSFQIDGQVVEVLRGGGCAVIAGQHREVMVNRGTDGVHFEKLYVGQTVICDVAKHSKRVLHAHQQTLSMQVADTDAGAAPGLIHSAKP